MKKSTITIILSFILLKVGFGQVQTKIDSLLNIVEVATQDTIKVKNLLRIGNEYEDNNPDTSLYFYQKALKLAKTTNNQKFIAKCYYNIAELNYYQVNNDKALKYYFKSIEIYIALNNKYKISLIYGDIGITYANQSNYDKALKYYQKALIISEEINDRYGISSNLGNIGLLYANQNNYEKAMLYYKKALKVNEGTNNKDGIAINLLNIGNIFSDQSNYDKALEYYQKSISISEEIDDKEGIASIYSNIGIIFKEQGDYDKALKYYQKALAIYTELGDKEGIGLNYGNIGKLYNKLHDYKKALIYEYKSLNIAKEIGDISQQSFVYSYLSEIYTETKQYEKALLYTDSFIIINDIIFNTEKAKSIAEMNTRYETEKKEKKIIKQKAELKTSQLEAEKEKAEKENQQTQRNMFIIAFGLMAILAGFAYKSYNQKKKANVLLAKQKELITEANQGLNQQNEEINAQKDHIEEQRDIVVKQKTKIEKIHHQISESINYATRLQDAILPEEKILEKYLSQHFVLFKPKDKVSGDFYWWSHVENHTIITAADSTGHGVPGAFMSMLGSSFLREIVQKEYIINTGKILDKLRKEIIKALKQTGETEAQKDGMDMAIVSIDSETNMLQFSGAHNPLYILTNRKLDNIEPFKEFENFYEIKADKMPISIYEKMDNFITTEIQLEKGDQLYMFSDGFIDQFGGPKGKKFKRKLFKQLIVEIKDKPMKEQKELLNNAFETWKGELEQIDDVLIIGIMI